MERSVQAGMIGPPVRIEGSQMFGLVPKGLDVRRRATSRSSQTSV